jgi:hypothetical protein
MMYLFSNQMNLQSERIWGLLMNMNNAESGISLPLMLSTRKDNHRSKSQRHTEVRASGPEKQLLDFWPRHPTTIDLHQCHKNITGGSLPPMCGRLGSFEMLIQFPGKGGMLWPSGHPQLASQMDLGL